MPEKPATGKSVLESRGLTFYTRPKTLASTSAPIADLVSIPEHHRSMAREDGKEDEDYYRDVQNIHRSLSNKSSSAASSQLSSSNNSSSSSGSGNSSGAGSAGSSSSISSQATALMSNMIRVSAESIGFFQGTARNAYDDYIGSRILYPNYTYEIKKALFENASLQRLCVALGLEELEQLGIRRPSIASVSAELSAKGTASTPSSLRSLLADEERKFKRLLTSHVNRIHRRLQKNIDGLVADMSSPNILGFGVWVVNNILVRMYNQGIHIKQSEFMEVREAAVQAQKDGVSLLFLPCHKSHVDYIVISYIFYRLGIGLPHIAAGENLNLPLLGSFLAHGGAFFIRRAFGDDFLYSELVREYIELLLKRGLNIEVFIEGTRSRTGKLLNPRLGMLKIIMEAVLLGKCKDVIVVPMSIDYDKVVETESYVTELLGTPKKKESLAQVLSNANILNLKFGRIDIRFAKPFSLRKWAATQVDHRSTDVLKFNPLDNTQHKATLLQSLGYRVLADINSVSVIMPTALVGCVILTLRGRGVGREELIRRVTWLRREIILKGGKVADFGGTDTGTIVDRALHALAAVVAIRGNLVEPVIYPAKRFELSLYRNQVIHHFVHETFVCASMYTIIKKGRTHLKIQKDCLLQNAVFLSKVLKGEFIFRPGTAEANLDESIVMLNKHAIVDIETPDERPLKATTLSELPDSYAVKLSESERKNGRENYDFYCFLIWPFIETYWMAAVSLFCLIPSHGSGLNEKQLMERVQAFGRTLYYEGDLGYFESINKETLKNAFKRYQEMGFLVTRVVVKEHRPAENEFPQPATLPNLPISYPSSSSSHKKLQKTKTEVLYAVAPEYENEIIPFFANVDMNTGKDGQETSMSIQPSSDIYKSKLWRFVEELGAYRREGKHRRDNEVTGMRVLRLAILAREREGSKL